MDVPAAVHPTGLMAADIRHDLAREQRNNLALIAPAVVVMALILLVPLAWILGQSFVEKSGAIGFGNYGRLFEDGAYVRSFLLTIRLSLTVVLICGVLGYLLSYGMTAMPAWAARICLALVTLPFWTSTLVRTYAWLVLLQNRGVINNLLVKSGFITERLPLAYNLTGTLIGMVHIMLPFMVFPLYAGLRRIDPDYARASTGLGASPIYTFWRVILPLSAPGFFAGAALVFVACLGLYVTPAMLGGGRVVVMAIAIERDVDLNFAWGPASAAAVIYTAAVLSIFVAVGRYITFDRLFQR